MLIELILLLIGFVFLIKGADFFVNGASALGIKFNLPQIVIGLTIVSIGTSLPELFVNISGSLVKNNDIVLSNILGSNLFNSLLILGISSIIFPIYANSNTIRKELPFTLIVTAALFVLSFDETFGEVKSVISRGDGLILIAFMIFFIYYLYKISQNSEEDGENIKPLSTFKIIIYLILGFIGLFLGGEWVVSSAVSIAKTFNLSDKLIGITIISIGTSLPELVTSVVAAYKKNNSIALGNIIGSNIFNILLVISVSSLIFPIKVQTSLYTIDYSLLIISTFLFFLALKFKKESKIARIDGILMVTLYVLYMVYNIIMI